jgi:hypothetical protein
MERKLAWALFNLVHADGGAVGVLGNLLAV